MIVTIAPGNFGNINCPAKYIDDDMNPLILLVVSSKIMSTVLFLLCLYGWNFATRVKAKTNTSAAAGR